MNGHERDDVRRKTLPGLDHGATSPETGSPLPLCSYTLISFHLSPLVRCSQLFKRHLYSLCPYHALKRQTRSYFKHERYSQYGQLTVHLWRRLRRPPGLLLWRTPHSVTRSLPVLGPIFAFPVLHGLSGEFPVLVCV